jgi:hypothetical protein
MVRTESIFLSLQGGGGVLWSLESGGMTKSQAKRSSPRAGLEFQRIVAGLGGPKKSQTIYCVVLSVESVPGRVLWSRTFPPRPSSEILLTVFADQPTAEASVTADRQLAALYMCVCVCAYIYIYMLA